jgi:hypothetical protein
MPPKRENDPRLEFMREFVRDLETPHHSLKTRKDVQTFTEKVVNGIMMGVVTKEKAAPLGVFLPLAYKMAKELETNASGPPGLNITFKQEQSVTLQMSEAEMDAYLNGNEQVRVEVLEKMEQTGQISFSKAPNKQVNINSEVKPENVKTDLDGIVQITAKTDLPLTKEQARRAFGRSLNDKRHVSTEAGPDMTGFGELFKQKNMRKLAPPGALHEWKGKYETDGGPYGQLWFTCQVCFKRQPNVDKEFCEGKKEEDSAEEDRGTI